MTEPTKKEKLLDILNEMIKSYENLPDHAMMAPITHYDYVSLLMLFRELFKASDSLET